MKSPLRCFILFSVMIVCAPVAMAHPGHGDPNAAHFLSEPVHQFQLFTIFVAIAAVTTALAMLRRTKRKLNQRSII